MSGEGAGTVAVEVGLLTVAEWPWLVSRSAATAWAHVDPALRDRVNPQAVAARVEQNLRALLTRPGSAALVARAGGAAAGYLVVALVPDELTGLPVGLFYDIFVEPAYRGTGVSHRLTAAGEAHCRAWGASLVRRYIDPGNEPSLRHALREGCRIDRLSLVKVL